VNPPKLLLDEHLSPSIAVVLRSHGVDVAHVRDRALNGSSDAEVFECAFVEDRVVVTINVVDFVRLARARGLHAGLVLLEEGGTRDEQLLIVQRALDLIMDEFTEGRDMINRALRLVGGDHEFVNLPVAG
jgi:predicted nuclease of predicted toxin-antitoxin system